MKIDAKCRRVSAPTPSLRAPPDLAPIMSIVRASSPPASAGEDRADKITPPSPLGHAPPSPVMLFGQSTSPAFGDGGAKLLPTDISVRFLFYLL